MVKIIAIILVSLTLLGAATPEEKPSPATCQFAGEVEMLAMSRLAQLERMFKSTEPDSVLREVVGAEIIGIIDLLRDVERFKKKNCKES